MIVKIWFFFSSLGQSFASFMKVILWSKWFLRLKKTNEQQIIILGNGPSFLQTFEKYQDEILASECLAVNVFAKSELYTKVKPKLYVLGGPELWKEGLGAYYDKLSNDSIGNILQKTTWPMTVLVEWKAKKSKNIQRLQENEFIDVQFFNPTPVEGLTSCNNWFYKRGLGIPRPHNVLIPSIMNCIRMGYKKLIIVGADHSWHEQLRVDEQNNVLLNQEHFYDKKESWETMKLKAGRSRFIHEVFHKWMLSFKGYIEIERFASKIGVKIYNSSEKSYIDGFERKEFKNALDE